MCDTSVMNDPGNRSESWWQAAKTKLVLQSIPYDHKICLCCDMLGPQNEDLFLIQGAASKQLVHGLCHVCCFALGFSGSFWLT